MASRYNEGKAIEAVLQRIESRDGAKRQGDGHSPDDEQDANPLRRVDYVCSIGSALHAFEHTGIEPFADQIELEVHNEKLFGPLTERFVDEADLSEYDLAGGKFVRFELKPKDAQVNLRLPASLLDAVRVRAKRAGVPYQRFIRLALERAVEAKRR